MPLFVRLWDMGWEMFDGIWNMGWIMGYEIEDHISIIIISLIKPDPSPLPRFN